MDIKIVCQNCGSVLTDRFNASSVQITKGSYHLEMECIECEKLYNMSISIFIARENKS